MSSACRRCGSGSATGSCSRWLSSAWSSPASPRSSATPPARQWSGSPATRSPSPSRARWRRCGSPPAPRCARGTSWSICSAPNEAAELEQLEVEHENRLAAFLIEPSDGSARAALADVAARLDRARARLAEKSARAPSDGVVSDVRARPGMLLAPGDPLMTVVDGSAAASVVALLPGGDRPELREGMELRLALDGHGDTEIRAVIDEVGSQVIGPHEARRFLGAGIGDALPIPGPVVVVHARHRRQELREQRPGAALPRRHARGAPRSRSARAGCSARSSPAETAGDRTACAPWRALCAAGATDPVRPAARVDRLRRRLAVHGDGVSRPRGAARRGARGDGHRPRRRVGARHPRHRRALRPRRSRHQGRASTISSSCRAPRSCTGSSTTSSSSTALSRGRRPHRRPGDRPARRAARQSSTAPSPASRSIFEPAGPLHERASREGPAAALPCRRADVRRACSAHLIMSLLLRLFALALPLITGMIIDQVVPRSDYHLLVIAGSGVGMLIAFNPGRDRARAPAAAPPHRARHPDDARLPRPHGRRCRSRSSSAARPAT